MSPSRPGWGPQLLPLMCCPVADGAPTASSCKAEAWKSGPAWESAPAKTALPSSTFAAYKQMSLAEGRTRDEGVF